MTRPSTNAILDRCGLIKARPKQAGVRYQYAFDILCAKTGALLLEAANVFRVNSWLVDTGRAEMDQHGWLP